jgi:hypothetical protein
MYDNKLTSKECARLHELILQDGRATLGLPGEMFQVPKPERPSRKRSTPGATLLDDPVIGDTNSN